MDSLTSIAPSMFPLQKLEGSKKDKEWAKKCVNYIVNETAREFHGEVTRMLSSYKAVNSQLEEEDFRSICRTLGVSAKYGNRYIEAFNKLRNIYSTVKGEELSRPLPISVTDITPDNLNAEDRIKEAEWRRYVGDLFKYSVESIMISGEKGADPKALEEKYKDLLDEQKILKKIASRRTAKESAVNKLMKSAIRTSQVRFIKNETFGDAFTAGREMVELYTEPSSIFPIIRQLNPLNVFFHKNPDSPFIHESDYVGYKEKMTVGKILDRWPNMKKTDSDKLLTYAYNGLGTYGTTDSYDMYGKVAASSFEAVTRSGMYPTGINKDPNSEVVIDGVVFGIPHSANNSSAGVVGRGLYGSDTTYRKNFGIVYTIYWKAYRKLYKYQYTDDYGEIVTEIVDEDFVIPKNAKKVTEPGNGFDEPVVKMVWYDTNNLYCSAEVIWIPEIWKGVRINGDIFVELGPVQHAYQSLLNPYKVKIPVYGFIYNARNSGGLSMVDIAKPWLKLHYAIMAKLIKNLSTDKGVMTFLNVLMLDKEIGYKRTLEIAQEQNLILYNPMQYANGAAAMNNTLKVAERIDATNSESIQYYIKLLEFIERNLEESVGMSAQRLARTKEYSTATDNQRDTLHSMNITESLFFAHDMLWEQIMQGYMEMMISKVHEDTRKVKVVLDDGEYAVVDLSMVRMEDEYSLRISDTSKDSKILETLQQLSLSLVQNDKARLSTLINMMRTDDLSEFASQIRAIELENEVKEMRIQEMNRQHEEEMLKREIEARESAERNALTETYLRGKMDQDREHIRGRYLVTSYNMKNDSDADGSPDVVDEEMKYQEFLRKVGADQAAEAQRQQEIDLRKEELQQRKIEHGNNLAQKERIRIDNKDKVKNSKPS